MNLKKISFFFIEKTFNLVILNNISNTQILKSSYFLFFFYFCIIIFLKKNYHLT